MKYLENYNIVIPRQFHHHTSLMIFTSTKKLHCLKQMGLFLKKCLVSKNSLKTVIQVKVHPIVEGKLSLKKAQGTRCSLIREVLIANSRQITKPHSKIFPPIHFMAFLKSHFPRTLRNLAFMIMVLMKVCSPKHSDFETFKRTFKIGFLTLL